MSFDRTNTGTLGTNKRKTKDTHPPYAGQINVDGVEYWVSAWVKHAKDNPNEKFFSMSFKKKDKQPNDRQPSNDQGGSDIPI